MPQSELLTVMELITFIEKGRFKGTNTEAFSLLEVANVRIIEFLKLHELNSSQLIALLKTNYLNRYKNSPVLNLISSEIVRNKNNIQLEDYLDIFCLLTI